MWVHLGAFKLGLGPFTPQATGSRSACLPPTSADACHLNQNHHRDPQEQGPRCHLNQKHQGKHAVRTCCRTTWNGSNKHAPTAGGSLGR